MASAAFSGIGRARSSPRAPTARSECGTPSSSRSSSARRARRADHVHRRRRRDPREDERWPGARPRAERRERIGVMPVPKRRPRRVVGPDGKAATMRGTTVVVRKDGESPSCFVTATASLDRLLAARVRSSPPRAGTTTHGSGASPPASSFAPFSTTPPSTMRSSARTGAGSSRRRFARACGTRTRARTSSPERSRRDGHGRDVRPHGRSSSRAARTAPFARIGASSVRRARRPRPPRRARLAATRRGLTPDERERYLGS